MTDGLVLELELGLADGKGIEWCRMNGQNLHTSSKTGCVVLEFTDVSVDQRVILVKSCEK